MFRTMKLCEFLECIDMQSVSPDLKSALESFDLERLKDADTSYENYQVLTLSHFGSETIKGFICFKLSSLNNSALIYMLFVDLQFRNNGLGFICLEKLIERLAERKTKRISIGFIKPGITNRSLYKKFMKEIVATYRPEIKFSITAESCVQVGDWYPDFG